MEEVEVGGRWGRREKKEGREERKGEERSCATFSPRCPLPAAFPIPGGLFQEPLSFVHGWLVAQSCPTLRDFMDCNPPGSSVHEILCGRILEWVAISYSRDSSRPREPTWVSCITGGHFTT